MKIFAYSFWVLLIAALPVFSSRDKPVFLSKKKFKQVADRAHASRASVDIEFSQKFYDYMNQKVHDI